MIEWKQLKDGRREISVAKNPIVIQKINEAGISDSAWSGIKNSVYKCIGFDLHSEPGIIKVAQKLTKDSGNTVTEHCLFAVSSLNGAQYWFSYTSGKIWERTSAGTWRLVHTTTPAAGGAGCLGAAEYGDYIYWATESRLHRIATTDADDNDWASDAVEDWATFTTTDDSFHPMVEINLVLYIGDGNLLAQVDAGTFSASALDLAGPRRIKSLGKYDTDILIGTYIADTVNKASVFRWNTVDTSFTSEDEVPEVGVNAFLVGDNHVYAQCGLFGNIYFYNGRTLELYRTVPGSYSSAGLAQVLPGSTANFNGRILFGFSNVLGNPADQGVYQIARHGYNYPWVLDLPYPVSERSGSDLALAGLEMGAILAVGSDLYVNWKNNTVFGVDKLDYSNLLEYARLETRVFNAGRYSLDHFKKFYLAYNSLPAGTAFNISYNKNYAGYVASTGVVDSMRNIITVEENIEATTLQLKVVPTVSSNSGPEMESIMIDYTYL